MLGLSALPASAATPPALSVVGPSTYTAVLRGGANHHTATLRLLVANKGDTSATVTPAVLIDDAATRGCDPQVGQARIDGSNSVDAHATTPIQIIVEVPQACSGRTGTIVLRAGIGIDAATTRFTLTRSLGAWQTAIPGLVALILALMSLVILITLAHGWWFLRVDRPLVLGPSWTPQGSWLTNLGAVGGVLTTVLAGSSYLADFVPGLVTAPFVGLNVAFVATVGLAPLAYYACSAQWRDPTGKNVTVGTGFGLAALMAITLFGIYGELGTVALLIHESNRSQLQSVLLIAALGVAAVAAGWYAIRSTRDLVKAAISANAQVAVAGVAL